MAGLQIDVRQSVSLICNRSGSELTLFAQKPHSALTFRYNTHSTNVCLCLLLYSREIMWFCITTVSVFTVSVFTVHEFTVIVFTVSIFTVIM